MNGSNTIPAHANDNVTGPTPRKRPRLSYSALECAAEKDRQDADALVESLKKDAENQLASLKAEWTDRLAKALDRSQDLLAKTKIDAETREKTLTDEVKRETQKCRDLFGRGFRVRNHLLQIIRKTNEDHQKAEARSTDEIRRLNDTVKLLQDENEQSRNDRTLESRVFTQAHNDDIRYILQLEESLEKWEARLDAVTIELAGLKANLSLASQG